MTQVGWSCAVLLVDFGGGRGMSGSGCLVCQLSSLGIFVFAYLSVFYVACMSRYLFLFFLFYFFYFFLYFFYFVYVTTAGGE